MGAYARVQNILSDDADRLIPYLSAVEGIYPVGRQLHNHASLFRRRRGPRC